jgi:hypothetical protein
MKIKELIYKTPEITEEKLLEFINNNISMLKNKELIGRINSLHKTKSINQALLDEYDLIQDKKSYLTKTQRDIIVGFVGLCMIKMVKGNGTSNSGESTNSKSTGQD